MPSEKNRVSKDSPRASETAPAKQQGRSESPEPAERKRVFQASPRVSEVAPVKKRSESGAGKTRSTRRPDRWYGVVRSLRTFYDHFRVAFPHLKSMPKYYSDEWAEAFRGAAREFVQKEDMETLQKVLRGVGYGTERWDRLAARSSEEVSRAIDALIKEEKTGVSDEGKPLKGKHNGELQQVQEVLGPDRWQLFLDHPESVVPVLDRCLQPETDESSEDRPEEEGDGPSPLTVDKKAELEELEGRFEELRSENREQQAQVEEKEEQIQALESQLRRAGTGEEGEPEEEAEGGSGAGLEDVSEEEGDGSFQLTVEKNAELEAELEEVKGRVEASREEIRKLQSRIGERDTQIHALQDQLRVAEAKVKKGGDQAQRPERRFQPPTELAGKVREYEQTLRANEQLISGLRSEVEKNEGIINELQDSLERERNLRRKFEEELEEERQQLREQMHRLGALLAGEEEIPSLEEFEQMSGDELMDYIEDVEKEKQRVMAGLDALDAQEGSYQKQLEVQQEEMDTVQEDLERYRESNLAEEVEGKLETIETQRTQLETLLNFSKNLKAQIAYLKERQDPLRQLVERLNLQEKALVRFVRINYDTNFMPSQAYE